MDHEAFKIIIYKAVQQHIIFRVSPQTSTEASSIMNAFLMFTVIGASIVLSDGKLHLHYSFIIPAEKDNRNPHRISFNGYYGTCIGFNGKCNGPCWSLLVIGHLLLLVIMGLVLVLMENVMDPVGLYW